MIDKERKEEEGKLDIKRLAAYALYFKKNLCLGLIFLLIAMLAQLAAPVIIRNIMDHEFVKNPINISSVIRLSGIYILVIAMDSVFQYLSGVELRITAMKIVSKMRIDLYKKIQSLELRFFDNSAGGRIVSKVMNDTEAVQNLYVKVMGQILISICYIIGVHVALFIISPGFALNILTVLPLIVFLVYFYNKKAKQYNNVIRTKLGSMNAFINETIQGISIIQVFGKQEKLKKDFDKITSESYKQKLKLLTINSTSTYTGVGIIKNIAYVILIYYFGKLFLNTRSATSVGMLYVYVGYIGIYFHHLTQIMEQLGEIEKSGIAASHVFELLDKKSVVAGYKEVDAVFGNVSFRSVSFYYKEGEYVLNNINIEAKKGETIALVGHTGSGKSSVMNLLLKFYEPQKGDIYIDDMLLKDLNEQSVRKHMAIVLQEPFLFTGTILSNITLGNESISREKAIGSLRLLGADDFLDSLKDGIDTPVVERGQTLSSGQRQLISFARALAYDPKILILDEATSSVDTETEQIIQKAMQVLMRGRTTFIIAHRLSTIRNADRIYMLEKGRIKESGTHEELIEKQGKYYDMYRTQRLIVEANEDLKP
jgi:multidrug ABC superfamily ATP binding cassette transporter, ABC protein